MRHPTRAHHQGVMHADPTRFDFDTQPFDVLDADVFCPTCGESFSSLCERCPDDNTPLVFAQSDDPLIGTIFDDRYRIVRELGNGTMGVVYEAIQLSVHRPVAIKVMRTELLRDPHATQRFLREARLLTRISHPNIVDVFDYSEAHTGHLYLVMELLRGNTLDAILEHEGPFTVQRTCEIAVRLCDALAAAHARGIVHRDLKPANIVLLPGLGDWVKVLDFGLAKQIDDVAEVTYVGAVIGTPLYMPPEAIRCDAPDPRSDLYALGCIIHELLTGAPPFASESGAMVLARQLEDAAPPLPDNVPLDLCELVRRLLAKSASARPSSALEVRGALVGCLARLARPLC